MLIICLVGGLVDRLNIGYERVRVRDNSGNRHLQFRIEV